MGTQRACVVGGCHVGRAVATRLAHQGIQVLLIDETAPEDRPAALHVHQVDAVVPEVLADLPLDEHTTFLATTPADGTNLLFAQLARSRFGVGRVIARVNDPRRLPAFTPLGIETVDATAVLGDHITTRLE